MFNLVEKRRWYFLGSGLVIGLGLMVMVYSTISTGSPFRLSIDFVGGSIYEFQFIEDGATEASIRDVFAANGEDNVQIQRLGSTDAEWRVKGTFEATEVDRAFEAQYPNVRVSLDAVDEIVFTLALEDDTEDLTTEAIRERFSDQDLENAFIRPLDGQEQPTWSIVVDQQDADAAEAALALLTDTYNATSALLAGEVYTLTVSDGAFPEANVTTVLESFDVEFIQRRPYRWSVRGSFQAEESIWWVAGEVEQETLEAVFSDGVDSDVSVEVTALDQVMLTVRVDTVPGDVLERIEVLRSGFREAGLSEVYLRADDDTADRVQVIVSSGDQARAEEVLQTVFASPLDGEPVAGTVYEVALSDESIDAQAVNILLADADLDVVIAQKPYRGEAFGGSSETLSQRILNDLNDLAEIDRGSLSIRSVSETVGNEVTQAAFLAVGLAAVVITGFIVLAFRQIPKATRYGFSAIAAMVHDVMIVMGVMSLMGLLANWEVDALFLTAVLTVVGFSVQDSIVVFDRIRENIPKHIGEPYETIVNRSIWETIHRSLATQLNAFFIMAAILLFGGETIRQFIAILFIGLLSGTYSSIFTAVPLLVAWEKGEIPFLQGDEAISAAE